MGIKDERLVVLTGTNGDTLRIVAIKRAGYDKWNYYLERSDGKDSMDVERWVHANPGDHAEWMLDTLGRMSNV